MLTSQTSSSSATSVLSPRNRELFKSLRVPEKFKADCIFARKIFIDDDFVVTVIISSRCELIECQDEEIINSIALKSYLPIGNNVINSEDVKLEVLIESSENVIYGLKVNSIVFGIERSFSQLKLFKVLPNVKLIKLVVCPVNRDACFLVKFNDNRKFRTKFKDEELESFMQNRLTEKFSNIYESANSKIETVRQKLGSITSELEEMSLKIQQEMPKLMLDDVSYFHLIK
jgi:uncharacterized protein YbaR (Trm112 family)